MARRRVHIRAPGVKTGSTIGPLGPFRGTLGIQWVVGSIAVGLVILLVVTYLLFKTPGPPFQEVGQLDAVPMGSAHEVLAGVFLGRAEDGEPFAVAEPANCPLEVADGYYLDCSGRKYGFDGQAAVAKRKPLVLLPVKVHSGDVYIDPTAAP